MQAVVSWNEDNRIENWSPPRETVSNHIYWTCTVSERHGLSSVGA